MYSAWKVIISSAEKQVEAFLNSKQIWDINHGIAWLHCRADDTAIFEDSISCHISFQSLWETIELNNLNEAKQTHLI